VLPAAGPPTSGLPAPAKAIGARAAIPRGPGVQQAIGLRKAIPRGPGVQQAIGARLAIPRGPGVQQAIGLRPAKAIPRGPGVQPRQAIIGLAAPRQALAPIPLPAPPRYAPPASLVQHMNLLPTGCKLKCVANFRFYSTSSAEIKSLV
jgi:hypothetical protein